MPLSNPLFVKETGCLVLSAGVIVIPFPSILVEEPSLPVVVTLSNFKSRFTSTFTYVVVTVAPSLSGLASTTIDTVVLSPFANFTLSLGFTRS